MKSTAGRVQPATVFVVDDNAPDVYILRMALHNSGIPNLSVVTDDGTTAIERCRTAGTDANVPVPNIVFLDLNLGRISGFDVLKAIRANPYLRSTVVMIVSGSEHSKDIARAYDLNANGYMFKGTDVNEMFEHVKKAVCFWLRCTGVYRHAARTRETIGTLAIYRNSE